MRQTNLAIPATHTWTCQYQVITLAAVLLAGVALARIPLTLIYH